jgi:hypothetical protein
MRDRRSRFALFVILLGLVSACGEPLVEGPEASRQSGGTTETSVHAPSATATTTTTRSPADLGAAPLYLEAGELGACPPELEPLWDPIPLFTALEIWDWIKVDSLGEPADAQALLPDDMSASDYWAVGVSGAALSSGAPTAGEYALRRETFDLARGEVERGAWLALAVGRDDPYVKLTASIRTDGTVVFVGRCLYTYSYWLDDVVEAVQATDSSATPESVLRELVVDPRGPVYAAYQQYRDAQVVASSWESRPSDLRSLNPAETPPAVLAGLQTVSITFHSPASWASFDGQLCTKTSIGWNGCLGFRFSVACHDFRDRSWFGG